MGRGFYKLMLNWFIVLWRLKKNLIEGQFYCRFNMEIICI